VLLYIPFSLSNGAPLCAAPSEELASFVVDVDVVDLGDSPAGQTSSPIGSPP